MSNKIKKTKKVNQNKLSEMINFGDSKECKALLAEWMDGLGYKDNAERIRRPRACRARNDE